MCEADEDAGVATECAALAAACRQLHPALCAQVRQLHLVILRLQLVLQSLSLLMLPFSKLVHTNRTAHDVVMVWTGCKASLRSWIADQALCLLSCC